ncbi:hypothetical protein LZ32DRAFT_359641 [Colletotrichum eremochloae]|nr:hypothetical protein LZ32DRAFT_359641 [Colletotrichum eremochloae]
MGWDTIGRKREFEDHVGICMSVHASANMHCLYGPPTKHPASTIPYPNGSNLSSAAEKESPQNGRDSQNDLQVTQSSGDISSMRSALPARLPVLVRNAWNEYGCDVTEVVFLAAAKHMMGLRPAGSSKPWTRSTRWGSRSASTVRMVTLNRLSSMVCMCICVCMKLVNRDRVNGTSIRNAKKSSVWPCDDALTHHRDVYLRRL